jgi:2-polyprenyl-6-methoxyphenol hydroxylase-like FAD-dependent oxidoreductase
MQGTPPLGTFQGNHAVVIGASMSGLLAARVLSAHFDKVTLYDRDSLPSYIDNRRGVPQGRHGHGLLASGLQGLKTLFPSLERELLDAGAVPGDVIGNFRWYQHGYLKAQFQSGLDGLLLSRPLLEVTIRRIVERLPNVAIVDGAHVQGLLASERRIEGLRVQRGTELAKVTADLIIDAAGRASRTPEWLVRLGYPPPPVDEVQCGIGYTTRVYRRRATDLGGNVGAIVAPRPPRDQRMGFMLAMEGHRWMVTAGGWNGNHAPVDPQGFVEFVRHLSRPDIYDVIKDAEPLTEPTKFEFPSSLRRRYERLTQFPGNYLVMGDALSSFNPLYGQGMSVATLEALALADCLRSQANVAQLWRPFFKAAGRIIDTPWMIAAGSDFAYEGVTGLRPRGIDFTNWYIARVHKAASKDQTVCRAFFDVANLLRPAGTLFHPAIMMRVWRECWALRGPLAIGTGTGTGFDSTHRRKMIETH